MPKTSGYVTQMDGYVTKTDGYVRVRLTYPDVPRRTRTYPFFLVTYPPVRKRPGTSGYVRVRHGYVTGASPVSARTFFSKLVQNLFFEPSFFKTKMELRTQGWTDRFQTRRQVPDKQGPDRQGVQTDKVMTDRPQTDRFPTNRVQTDRLQTNRVQTDRVQTGRVQTDRVQTEMVLTNRVQTGPRQTGYRLAGSRETRSRQTGSRQTVCPPHPSRSVPRIPRTYGVGRGFYKFCGCFFLFVFGARRSRRPLV